MKKRLLAALATGLLVMGVGGLAQALTFSPGAEIAKGIEQLGTSKILDYIETLGLGFEQDYELYKSDVGKSDTGSFELYYETTYSETPTNPSDALITQSGSSWIANPGFMLVKDGNNEPWWYLFDLSSWDGKEMLVLDNFWPGNGAISHVAIYGGAPVPEPATMLLFGTGLAGLAGIARRKNKKNA